MKLTHAGSGPSEVVRCFWFNFLCCGFFLFSLVFPIFLRILLVFYFPGQFFLNYCFAAPGMCRLGRVIGATCVQRCRWAVSSKSTMGHESPLSNPIQPNRQRIVCIENTRSSLRLPPPGRASKSVVAQPKGSGMEAAADEEQEGLSAQSPAQAPPSSASSLPKVPCLPLPPTLPLAPRFSPPERGLMYLVSQEQSQVELELRLLQALEFYPPSKLKGGVL
jgi:hypothetical protein